MTSRIDQRQRGAIAAALVVLVVAFAFLAAPMTVGRGSVTCTVLDYGQTVPRAPDRDTGNPIADKGFNIGQNTRAGLPTACAAKARDRVQITLVAVPVALALIGVTYWFVSGDRRRARAEAF